MLTSRMQFHLPSAAVVVEPVIAWLLARDSRRCEARLKRLLELPIDSPAGSRPADPTQVPGPRR